MTAINQYKTGNVVMEAPFTLTLPAHKVSMDRVFKPFPSPDLYDIPYAACASYHSPRASIISQSFETHNYCMELYLYNVKRRFILGTFVDKPAVIFCYALSGQARSLCQTEMQVPDLQAGFYAGYSLPEGEYKIQLARGVHAFFYFAFEINYLTSIIQHLPNLSALILPLLSPSFTFQIFPIYQIDFGVRKAIKQMQNCSSEAFGLDLSLLSGAWDLLSIYENQLEARKHVANKTSSEIAREVYEYIKQHFTETDYTQVPEIANRFHISEKTLSRIFKNVFGITIHQLIIRLRMERALYLLRDSSSQIKEIAAETGYPDIYSFSRAFKKHYGYSPREAKNK